MGSAGLGVRTNLLSRLYWARLARNFGHWKSVEELLEPKFEAAVSHKCGALTAGPAECWCGHPCGTALSSAAYPAMLAGCSLQSLRLSCVPETKD